MTFKNATFPTALAAAMLVGSAFAAAPAQAQRHGYDRMEQPYGRDRMDGYRTDRSGAENPSWAEERHLFAREMFRRGYRMGRMDQLHQQNMQPGMGSMMPNDSGTMILLLERDKQQQVMRDLRQSLQSARTALQQGNRSATEQALNQADQTLQQADALRNQQQIMQSLGQADQALQRGDREAVQRAIQQARQAMRDSGGQQQGGSQAGGQLPGTTSSTTVIIPSTGGAAQGGSGQGGSGQGGGSQSPATGQGTGSAQPSR